MSIRILNNYCRLLVTGSWRRLATSSICQKEKGSGENKKHRNEENPKGEIEEELKTAVKSVAKSIAGDAAQTESDLLQQLLKQTKLSSPSVSEVKPTTTPTSRDLLVNMTVKRFTEDQFENNKGKSRNKTTRNSNENNRTGQQSRLVREGARTKYELFEGPDLGIFDPPSKQSAPVAPREYDRTKTLRHRLEEEMRTKSSTPPSNAFQEMIRWTEDGKLWSFPIDNEAGMKEEAKVGFHEHVFLDDQITDFPRKGPIRHFMELVVVGLSKNPYLSVSDKHEHINWFRQYFKDKDPVLKESLGEASKFLETGQKM
ncbi:28S ribosomal protein S31, mitochondrial [Patella vulgata]|uniref:28S ribosomal protein S31, mitochondrial n=1 Tax=Patella vulgata TaxID=6465 RepID=UPI00217F9D5E|nr:28S ribosomal protein S31, mitochondrial [Patella vulgata]XP_055954556.1 28S ribosomal protein S31, mitochondrial [Patella vulgata]